MATINLKLYTYTQKIHPIVIIMLKYIAMYKSKWLATTNKNSVIVSGLVSYFACIVAVYL